MKNTFLWAVVLAFCSIIFFSCNKEKDAKEVQDDLIEKYLNQNNKDSLFREIGSNCWLKVLQEGDSDYASDDTVKIKYDGSVLQDNFKFAKDCEIEVKFGNPGLIKGFNLGIQYVKRNSKNILIVPFQYGYGDRRVGDIDPYSTLLFTFEAK